MTDPPADLSEVRKEIHRNMGGAEKVRDLHLYGRRTARDVVDHFFDAGSFVEVGTFAGMSAGEPPTVAGDGRVTGHATMNGRPVGVVVDDVTVKRASSTTLNARKAERVVHVCKRAGAPLLFVGEAGGARLPDTLRGEVFASDPIYPWLLDPDKPPIVTAIVGESYGGSSFVAAMSDITVMTRGAVMALTSPRVVSMATGATVTPEELGGADVLAERTDLVDIVVRQQAELDSVLRRALGFFTHPSLDGFERPDADLRELVPGDLSATYDVHSVIDAIVDVDSFLELGAHRGRSLVTGLGRVDGRVVGIIASQPMHAAGALSPPACAKAEQLVAMCDRYGFPVISLVDTPGFQVGVDVEHSGMLRRAMELIRRNTAATCPVVTLVLRKAFGLAFFAMLSPEHGGDVVLAWPDAQIGFMAPSTAANILYADQFERLPPQERKEKLAAKAAELRASNRALDVAAAMGIDEIIDEESTVTVLRRYLDQLAPVPDRQEREASSRRP